MRATIGGINYSAYFYVTQDVGGTNPGEPKTGMLFSDLTSASFMRQGAARVAITPITLASASAVHADGGFIQVDATNMPGLYRLDIPDAALAAGVDLFVASIVPAGAQNAVASPLQVDLTIDLTDTVRAGLTALPDAAADAAGGLPISDTGGLDLDTKLANTNEITVARMGALTDWINGGRLDLLLDAIPTTAMRGTDNAATAVSLVVVGLNVLAIQGTGFVQGTDALDKVADKLDNIQGATFSTSTDSLEAIRNRGDAAWATGAAGLTEQNVRDAMKLTPTAGAPSSGSVDEHLDDILTDTGTTIPAQITALVVPDAAGVVPTAIENRQEMDSNSVDLNTLVAGQTTINNNVLLIDTAPMRGSDGALLAADINLTAGAVDTVTDVINDVGITQAGADKVWVSSSRTLTDGIQKNTAFNNLEFLMVLASDHVTPATGLTVTGTRSIDGGAFGAITGAIAEVSNGIYQVDLLAADTNGDVITYRFSSGTADDTFITVTTA